MSFTDEEIKALESKKNFLFSAETLKTFLSSAPHTDRQDFIKAVQKRQIPVLKSADELEVFTEKYGNYLIVPYFLHKENPEELLLSSSSMHMNWLWPNLFYVPIDISNGNDEALRRVYEIALKKKRILFMNHTIPHKSNRVMREMFGHGQGEGDYLIRDKDTFRIAEGNGRAFVAMASDLLGSGNFSDVSVVIMGVGGAGTLAAKSIQEKKPEKLILVDIADKSALAEELGGEFYQGVNALPELKAKRIVTIDASSHFEEGIPESIALDFVKKYDSLDNVFIDYNVNTPLGAYRNLKTKCGVGREYLAFTNYILVHEIRDVAAAMGVNLPFISRETFDAAVADSLFTRDSIREKLQNLS